MGATLARTARSGACYGTTSPVTKGDHQARPGFLCLVRHAINYMIAVALTTEFSFAGGRR